MSKEAEYDSQKQSGGSSGTVDGYAGQKRPVKIAWTTGDGRTYESEAEAEVAAKVGNDGGFTVFWVTETKERAKAADKLIAEGVLIRAERQPFPFCAYHLKAA